MTLASKSWLRTARLAALRVVLSLLAALWLLPTADATSALPITSDLPRLVSEFMGSNLPFVEYVRGSDWGGGVGGILYTSRAGTLSWAHYNGRGDVVSRSNDTGNLTYAASYEAFGTRTGEGGANDDRQRANTKEEDRTGLLNEGMRYRDLETGIFLTRDPAGFVDGPNVYTYVRQNPWSAFDPEGLAADKPEYQTHDAALVDASLSLLAVKPDSPRKDPGKMEYAANIWYDPDAKSFGYSKPYTSNQEGWVAINREFGIPKGARWVSSTHNHPWLRGWTDRFSDATDNLAVNPEGDKGAADKNQAPMGLITLSPTAKEVPPVLILKYTPRKSGSSESWKQNGTVEKYNQNTKQFEAVKAPELPKPSIKPEWIGIDGGYSVFQMPDGKKLKVESARRDEFLRQYEK